MSTLSFSDLTAILLENYGSMIADAVTLQGPGNWLVPEESMFGRLRAAGRVFIGGADGSDRHPREWGIHTATASASWIDGSDNWPAASQETYAEASLDWKRAAITMEFDNLVRLATRKSTVARGGVKAISEDMRRKLKALIHLIELGLASDGTGSSNKQLTGFGAFLSASNTYAGINQSTNSYWQAKVTAAASATLARSHLRTVTGNLWDDGVLDESSEIWMSRTQWRKYVDLFRDSIRYDKMGGGVEKAQPIYDDGVVSLPIYIIRGVPSDEIWFPTLNQLELRFLDHAPEDELSEIRDEEKMHEGVPVGFEQIETGKDSKSIAMKAYPQLVCCLPRTQGALTGLAT